MDTFDSIIESSATPGCDFISPTTGEVIGECCGDRVSTDGFVPYTMEYGDMCSNCGWGSWNSN